MSVAVAIQLNHHPSYRKKKHQIILWMLLSIETQRAKMSLLYSSASSVESNLTLKKPLICHKSAGITTGICAI